MKRIFKFTGLLCLTAMLLLLVASCDQLPEGLQGLLGGTTDVEEFRTTEETTPEKTTPEAHEHSEEILEAVSPNCTETGLTEGVWCPECEEILVEQEEISVLGHAEVIDGAVEPTCTENGLTEGKRCSRCEEVLVKQEVILASHTEVIDEAVEPTCTETGCTEGKHCSVCGEVFVEQTMIDMKGHQIESVLVVEPTANANGSIKNTCTVCGEFGFEEIVPIRSDGKITPDLLGYTGEEEEIVIPAVFQHEGWWYRVEVIGSVYGWDTLKSVTISDGITKIGDMAFFHCDNLTTAKIPNSVTSIGEYAFRECYNLRSITIPQSVASIGNEAFAYCYKLWEVYNLSPFITVEKGSESNGCLGLYAFGVYDSTEVESKVWTDTNGYVFYEDGEACYLVAYTGSDPILTLPASCNGKNYEVNYYAFIDCPNIVSLTIPESVTAFMWPDTYWCHKLVELYDLSPYVELGSGVVGAHIEGDWMFVSVVHTSLEEANNVWIDTNGYIFFERNNACYLMGYNGSETELTLPASCNGKKYWIHPSAFENCNNITSVVIPANVEYIGSDAFRDCSSLVSVTFSENSQLIAIGNNVFCNCSGLTSITIPNSVTSIHYQTFRDCNALTTITFQGTVEQWKSITLEFQWNQDVPATEVICSDGVVSLN